MNRKEAIREICFDKLEKLTAEERADALLNWWGIDEEDEVFHLLSPELQKEILKDEDSPDANESTDIKYSPLILIHLEHGFIGARNEYIADEISDLKGEKISVEGEVEDLFSCPCCGYKTLEVRGEYFICEVCMWEDAGFPENEPDRYSFANYMTLNEAKAKFESNPKNSDILNKYNL